MNKQSGSVDGNGLMAMDDGILRVKLADMLDWCTRVEFQRHGNSDGSVSCRWMTPQEVSRAALTAPSSTAPSDPQVEDISEWFHQRDPVTWTDKDCLEAAEHISTLLAYIDRLLRLPSPEQVRTPGTVEVCPACGENQGQDQLCDWRKCPQPKCPIKVAQRHEALPIAREQVRDGLVTLKTQSSEDSIRREDHHLPCPECGKTDWYRGVCTGCDYPMEIRHQALPEDPQEITTATPTREEFWDVVADALDKRAQFYVDHSNSGRIKVENPAEVADAIFTRLHSRDK